MKPLVTVIWFYFLQELCQKTLLIIIKSDVPIQTTTQWNNPLMPQSCSTSSHKHLLKYKNVSFNYFAFFVPWAWNAILRKAYYQRNISRVYTICKYCILDIMRYNQLYHDYTFHKRARLLLCPVSFLSKYGSRRVYKGKGNLSQILVKVNLSQTLTI